MLDALRFWALIEVIGLGGAALAGVAFARLPGSGLGLGKVLGLLLVTWLAWLGASTTLVPYGWGSAALWVALVCALGLLAAVRRSDALRAAHSLEPRGRLARRRRRRLAARAPAEPDPVRRRLFLGAEAVFAAAFAAGALLVAFAPDVWGTETPMDMAFVAAVNRASAFPPPDPWLAGTELNYYYLGHVASALLVKLAAVEPARGYNLALAAVLALTASAVFTLAGTLWAAARGPRGAVRAGAAAAVLVVVLGNLEGTRLLVDRGGPLAAYPWFDASRVIEGTINEFPWFSFLVGDLHAHFVALPFTVLAVAVAVQVALLGFTSAPRRRALAEGGVAALAIGTLYAINAWSYPVAGGLLVLAVAAWLRDPRSGPRRADAVRRLVVVLSLGVLLVLPFHLSFEPAARGVAAAEDGSGVGDAALVYGTVAAPAALLFLGRLLDSRRALRNAVWLAVAAAFGGSLLAATGRVLAGLLAVALAVALQAVLAVRMEPVRRAGWLLAAGGIGCLLAPELVVVRDEFEGSGLARMNTVFKLGFQGWLLLGLAGVVAFARLPGRLLAAPVAAVVVAAAAYPVAGTYASRGGFSTRPTLDGLGWLRDRAPGDVAAIAWLQDNAPAGAVVLESVGEDYSAFGHARISTFTGLPTVLGWAGHERQWGHDPGTRARDVERMYRGDVAEARPLLRRYGVRFVVLGPLERTDHGDAGAAKWDPLGRRVLDRDGTTVWELRPG